MRITFVTRKFGNVERNSHCDVLHITPIRVARLFLGCNGDFAIKAYEAVASSRIIMYSKCQILCQNMKAPGRSVPYARTQVLPHRFDN